MGIESNLPENCNLLASCSFLKSTPSSLEGPCKPGQLSQDAGGGISVLNAITPQVYLIAKAL